MSFYRHNPAYFIIFEDLNSRNHTLLIISLLEFDEVESNFVFDRIKYKIRLVT